MVQTILGPDHDLAKRLSKMERDIANLNTRDVLQNASIGIGGLTVNGGSINITNGGSLIVTGTGTIQLSTGTFVANVVNSNTTVSAGTSITAGTDVHSATSSTTGTATVGGDIDLTGDMYTPHGRATPVTTGYVSAWLNADGRLGASASSIAFKQDVEPADMSAQIQAVFTLGLVRFRFIADVEANGDAAPWHTGSLAEYMAQTALTEWVPLDSEGKPFAINWEHITIPLIAVVQNLDARLKALEAKP